MNVIDLTKAARECGFELSVELVVDTNGGQDQVRYVLTGPLNYEKATRPFRRFRRGWTVMRWARLTQSPMVANYGYG